MENWQNGNVNEFRIGNHRIYLVYNLYRFFSSSCSNNSDDNRLWYVCPQGENIWSPLFWLMSLFTLNRSLSSLSSLEIITTRQNLQNILNNIIMIIMSWTERMREINKKKDFEPSNQWENYFLSYYFCSLLRQNILIHLMRQQLYRQITSGPQISSSILISVASFSFTSHWSLWVLWAHKIQQIFSFSHKLIKSHHLNMNYQ